MTQDDDVGAERATQKRQVFPPGAHANAVNARSVTCVTWCAADPSSG
jgi:hypothetical protein